MLCFCRSYFIIWQHLSIITIIQRGDYMYFTFKRGSLFLLSFLFFLFANCTITNAYNIYKVKPGDFLTTNRTSSYGLTGHAGIVTNNRKVLTITGYHHHPIAQKLSTWKKFAKGKSYWVKIWHEKNNHARKRAATIVWKTYHSKNYKKIKYGFGGGLGTTSITYCSKMVYQAYSFQTNKHSNIGFYISNPFGAIVTPYHLDNYFPSHGKYKLIYRGRE